MGSKRLRERASKYAKNAIKFEENNQKKKAALNYYRAVKTLSKLLGLNPPNNLEEIYKKRITSYKKKLREALDTLGAEKGKTKTESDTFKDAIVVEDTNIGWADIGGIEKAKESIKEATVWPLRRPDLFKGARKPWHGILLFGPPGCGKTLLAKAVSNKAEASFFNVDSATILSKWFGKSEKLTKKLFTEARNRAPSIIYLDEVESIAGKRKTTQHEAMNRVKTVFLSQMDGINSSNERIIVIGSTNLPEEIDMAFRRRFEKRIFVPPPNQEARKEILKIHLRDTEITSDVDLDEIARKTEGFSGHDLELLVREAAMNPIRELASKKLLSKEDVKVRKVNMKDFRAAIKKRKPSLDKKEIEHYREWAKKFAN